MVWKLEKHVAKINTERTTFFRSACVQGVENRTITKFNLYLLGKQPCTINIFHRTKICNNLLWYVGPPNKLLFSFNKINNCIGNSNNFENYLTFFNNNEMNCNICLYCWQYFYYFRESAKVWAIVQLNQVNGPFSSWKMIIITFIWFIMQQPLFLQDILNIDHSPKKTCYNYGPTIAIIGRNSGQQLQLVQLFSTSRNKILSFFFFFLETEKYNISFWDNKIKKKKPHLQVLKYFIGTD